MVIKMDEIKKLLLGMGNDDFRVFQQRIVKVPLETVIGIKTPELRKIAKALVRDRNEEKFLSDLPHTYFEENQLHAFILSECRDFNKAVNEVDRFLPYVDNWATCDQLRPKCFKKNHGQLISYVKRWLGSEHIYTVRFAMGMLLVHFLDDDFSDEYPLLVSSVDSDEYYVNMMQAWYFAEALVKQQERTIYYFSEKKLSKWVNNKAIQKARESFRISPELKDKLLEYKM